MEFYQKIVDRNSVEILHGRSAGPWGKMREIVGKELWDRGENDRER